MQLIARSVPMVAGEAARQAGCGLLLVETGTKWFVRTESELSLDGVSDERVEWD